MEKITSKLDVSEYAELMMQLGQNVRTVFLDETGFNLWLRRSQGRAVKGRPIKRTVKQRSEVRNEDSLARAGDCMVLEGGARQLIPHVITAGKAAAWELHCSMSLWEVLAATAILNALLLQARENNEALGAFIQTFVPTFSCNKCD